MKTRGESRLNIVLAMLLGIGIKGISAIVEIGIQILMTRSIGVNGYGEYTFFVSLVETAYFVLFSGSIKLNTFYLSSSEVSLKNFKRQYLKKFVLPISIIMFSIAVLIQNFLYSVAVIILLTYYFAFDKSSTLLSCGHQGIALLGEYLMGRLSMLIGLIILVELNKVDIFLLCILYGIQFIVMLIWFSRFEYKPASCLKDIQVPVDKLIEFQKSDIANAFIAYAPAILQYIFGSAFTAGFTGILGIIKKIINFIAGPTAKVFLPECSRLYKNGELEKLKETYIMIVKVQMLVIGSAGTLLIGFPKLVLGFFNSELQQYSNLLVLVSFCLLLIASVGPVTGFLQMTGNEVVCNRNQWISIAVMFIVFFAMKNDEFFAVYGLCAQAISEGILKYYSLCKWFEDKIVSFSTYILLWFPTMLIYSFIKISNLESSIYLVIITLLFNFSFNIFIALQDTIIKKYIEKYLVKNIA